MCKNLACRDDIRAEVALERRKRIKVGGVPGVEGVCSGGRKLLLEEEAVGNRRLHRSIHDARLECVVRLADHVFVAG